MKPRLAILVFAAVVAGCAGYGPPVSLENFHPNSRQRDAALKALLGKDQYSEYVVIADTAEAADWLRRFWIKHDPTPTTPENEFKQEHERRVYHAIRYFGSLSKAGPPWDERGEVYIRFGEPNERRILQHGLDDDPYARTQRGRTRGRPFGVDAADNTLNKANAATEVWTYYRYDRSFQFEDDKGWGFFRMVPVTDPSLPQQDVASFYATRLNATDLQPAIYYHEYGRNMIDYALDVVRFHTGDNRWRVDVNLGYPMVELGHGPDSVSISLRRTLVIRDAHQDNVYGESGIINRRVDSVRNDNRLMVEQKVIDLPSGRYELAVTIEDLFSGKTGTYTKNFILPKYIASEVHEISDIEMASFVWTLYGPGAPFVKGGRMVMPLPSRVYLPGQKLAFYYEVYNLLMGKDSATHYTVSYEIRETATKKKHDFSEPGAFSGHDRDIHEYGSLDLRRLPPGDYVLSITVNDLVGNHKKSTVARFKKSG